MTNYECENRISDDEIISSLEVIATTRNCSECKIRNCNWGDCNCSQITANAAIDLINRQQAENINLKGHLEQLKSRYDNAKIEIERLKNENDILIVNADTAFQDGLNEAQDLYAEQVKAEVKSEAIREFAYRLKQKSEYYENGQGWEGRICYEDGIDKLLKETVGDTE